MTRKPGSTAAAAEAEGSRSSGKVAFVTVGTTRFDALVQAVTNPAALAALGAQGFARLVLQIGASPEPRAAAAATTSNSGRAEGSSSQQQQQQQQQRRRRSGRLSSGGGGEGEEKGEGDQRRVSVEWYRYKDTLQPDMEAADLIISHAGAGSVMEALALEKPLVVAVNAALMDDHQQELARAMEEQGYLVAMDPDHLVPTLQAGEYERLKIRPPPTPGLLPALLDNEMGFAAAGKGQGQGRGQGQADVVAAVAGGGGERGTSSSSSRRRRAGD